MQKFKTVDELINQLKPERPSLLYQEKINTYQLPLILEINFLVKCYML